LTFRHDILLTKLFDRDWHAGLLHTLLFSGKSFKIIRYCQLKVVLCLNLLLSWLLLWCSFRAPSFVLFFSLSSSMTS